MKEMVPSSDMVQEGPAAATIDAGSIDDYRVVRQLGNDGSTFLAHDASLDRAVVLSFLPEAADAHRERLAVASAFARASHPNLGRVHYVREGGARPYIVAAFVQGQRLDAIASPLPDDRVLDIGRGLAGALGALHAAGAAHGDVRKERVVLSAEGAPRLVGLDRARAAADDRAKHADIRDLLALLGSMAGVELKEKLSSLAEVDAGVATAEELRRALEILSRPTLARESLSENPYRGLGAFRREHAAVFFGRERRSPSSWSGCAESRGCSSRDAPGAGKSSIARAGVLPAMRAGERSASAGPGTSR